jgi:hypothetical protein
MSTQEACPHVSTVIKGSRHSRVRVCCDELQFPIAVSHACRKARLTSVRFAEPEKCTSELPGCLAAEVKCMRFVASTRNAPHGFCNRWIAWHLVSRTKKDAWNIHLVPPEKCCWASRGMLNVIKLLRVWIVLLSIGDKPFLSESFPVLLPSFVMGKNANKEVFPRCRIIVADDESGRRTNNSKLCSSTVMWSCVLLAGRAASDAPSFVANGRLGMFCSCFLLLIAAALVLHLREAQAFLCVPYSFDGYSLAYFPRLCWLIFRDFINWTFFLLCIGSATVCNWSFQHSCACYTYEEYWD